MPANGPERTRQARSTVVIVDDHPVVRRGLASLIDNEPDLVVCGHATTSQAALKVVAQTTPDLVIVDLALEGSDDGLDLVKALRVRHPKIPTLVLSMHPEAVYAERSLRAGARGYVSKQQLDDTVLIAVRRVLGGDIYMSDALAASLAKRFIGGHTQETGSPLAQLSDRQLQVFRLLGQGRGTREIAQRLHLSVKTIETHLEHLKVKLKLKSSADLAHHATLWVETGRDP